MTKKKLSRTLLILSLFIVISMTAAGCWDDSTIDDGKLGIYLNTDHNPNDSDSPPKYDPDNILTVGETYDSNSVDFKRLRITEYAVVGHGQVGIYGDEYLPVGEYMTIPADEVRVVDYAVVGQGQLGIRNETEYLPQGEYPLIPAEDVWLVGAANVLPGYKGIYGNEEKNIYLMLDPGYHPYPDFLVSMWPQGSVRFRTLYAGAWDSFVAGGRIHETAPCDSLICERAITKSDLKDTDVNAIIDVDVIFHFDLSEKFAKRLYELKDPIHAAQVLLVSEVRGSRSVSSILTPEEIKSPEGQAIYEEAMETNVNASIAGTPIALEKILARGIIRGSAEYEASLESSQMERDELQNQLDNAELAAQIAENELDDTTDTLNALQDYDPMLLWVVFRGLEVDPFLNTDGTLSEAPPQR